MAQVTRVDITHEPCTEWSFESIVVFVKKVLTRLLVLLWTTQGQPDPLNSAFHLTYNMVLNLLRVEEINPEYMLERSFYQFQNYASIPHLVNSQFAPRLSQRLIPLRL